MLKQTHFLLEMLGSEQIHSLCFSSYSFSLLQTKPLLTDSVRPPHVIHHLFEFEYRFDLNETYL